MKLIESFLQGKDPDGHSEDAIVDTADYVAVLDGATDKTGARYTGVAGGRFAAQILGTAIEALPRRCDAYESFKRLTHALREAIEDAGEAPADEPSASVAIYSVARRELWRVGDVSLMIDRVAHPGTKQTDLIAANARAAMLTARLAQGASIEEIQMHDEGRALILPLLEAQYAFRNNADQEEFGFGAVDGNEIPARFHEILPVAAGSSVVMCSDGYPVLRENLDEAEACLKQSLIDDPLRIGQHRTTKAAKPDQLSFDDRAYVRFLT